MSYMIKNDVGMFSPRNDGVLGTMLIGSALGGIVTFIWGTIALLDPGTANAYGLVLLFNILFPVVLAGYLGNADTRLGYSLLNEGDRWNTEPQPKRWYAWRIYRDMPKELKKRAGKITPDSLLAMDNDDASRVKSVLNDMVHAYREHERQMNRPNVNMLVNNIKDATTAYREGTKTIKELDSA